MKILYIHQYFKTPQEPGGTRSYWISNELIRRGHQVIMVTSATPRHPGTHIETIDGIEVHYIENEYSQSMSRIAKVKSFLRFVYKSIKETSKQENIDIVFATSTPLTVGAVALWLRKVKKFPYIFEVRDLWPEFPIQIGAIKNKLMIKALRYFEKSIYLNAEHIIGLSPGMVDGIVRTGIPVKKTSMVPNMSKPDCFFPHEKNINVANQFGINLNKFNIIHFGSMGVANGLQYLIEVANELKNDNVDIIMLGGGATESSLKRLANDYKLTNVKFLGRHPMSVVIEIVNCCDLSVTSFMNLPILKTNSPNKLFDSLSAGIPIAVNSAGWTKDMVEEYDCGFYASPERPEDFAQKVRQVMHDSETLIRWGKNARLLSEKVYDKKILTNKISDIIESTVSVLKNQI